MAKIIDPKIEVEDIHLSADKNSEPYVQQKINEWGYAIPVVKINEYPLNIGDIESLNVNVSMFGLPTFNFVIRDYNFKIQSTLKNKQDGCIIFIGTKDFYVKFNGLITSISTSFSKTIRISGIWYQKELFDFKQESFVDTSVSDILKKICEDTKLGLFTYNNNGLQIKPDYHLNPNTQQLTFISDTISMYTDNLWSIDTFGFLHIGDIKSILNKPIDKYTIDPKTCKQIEEGPQDIFLTFNRSKIKDYKEQEEKYKYSIEVDDLKIETNFSLSKINSTQNSILFTGTGSGRVLDMNSNLGIENSAETENTFSGFLNNKYPLRDEKINKLLYGNVITLELRNYMVEIVPFTLVNLEIFYPKSSNINIQPIKEDNSFTGGDIDYEAEPEPDKAAYRLDEIHSGKHMVIGYSYHYRKNRNGEPNAITQQLTLI